jgi:hypothetical protein
MAKTAIAALIGALGGILMLTVGADAAENTEIALDPRLLLKPSDADPILTALLTPKPGEKACFRRIYDAAHLARHPKQKITAADFVLSFVQLKPGHFSAGAESKKTYYRYEFGMSASLRGQPKKLYTAGDCGPMDTFVPDANTGEAKPGTRHTVIFCTVEEDGGAARPPRRPIRTP